MTVFVEAARGQMECGLQLYTRFGCTITLPGITVPRGEMIPRLTAEIDAAVKRFEDMGLTAPSQQGGTAPEPGPKTAPN